MKTFPAQACFPARPLIWIALLTISLGNVWNSRGADRLDEIRRLWKDQRYLEAAQSLRDYRKQGYGKFVEVDYMLATSLCRLPEHSRDGVRLLRAILYYYPLDPPNRELVENQVTACGANTPPPVLMAANALPVSGGRRASEVHSLPGVSGKEYYSPRSEGLVMPSIPVQVIKQIPREEFVSRLVPLSAAATAVEKARQRLDSRARVEAIGPFVVAALPGCTAQAGYVARILERYVNFYSSAYAMPRPTNFITVYLASSPGELGKLAGQLHGIRVSPYSIGYSFRDDLSLVGVVGGEAVGSLAHELFHLMVRNNFGDVPPWLDEGLAALYEVSDPWGNEVRGLPNWRGDVLRQLWAKRPAVDALVKMDWRGFDNEIGEYEITQQASNHAMARYFMLFLQDETKKLREVYQAFRRRDLEDLREDPRAASAELLEKVLGKPLAQVDREFARWFDAHAPAPAGSEGFPTNPQPSGAPDALSPNNRLRDIPNRANPIEQLSPPLEGKPSVPPRK